MGGDIGLTSAPGQGTTVGFELHLPPAPALAAAASGAAADGAAMQPAPGHRVLVVEDDEVNRMVVERFLRGLGQQPVCVGDIQAALHALAEQPVDIALIDMNLPDGDGREMLMRLRALPRHAATPAVLMSAHLPRAQVDGLLAAGFAAFLPKPFTRARLGAVLADLLAGEPGAAASSPGISADQGTAPARTASDAESACAADTVAVADAEWVDRDFLRAEEEALGRAVVDDIVAVFRAQGQTLVAALIAGAEAGDAEHCARLAHKLRGAAFNLGLARLGHCAASLEQEIGQIEADGKLAERVQDLVGIHERTLQALAQMLDAAPGRPDADAA
jgi:two-component system sensor histidine kinase TorS